MIGNPSAHVNQQNIDYQDKNQAVAYYEVALGTDRRFPKTRDNIVPFTNVGHNTTITFCGLDLLPGIGMYYFTVKAHSASYSVAMVTSNGFRVGYDGGVTCKYNKLFEICMFTKIFALTKIQHYFALF
jgi:hypothetical protein